MPEFDPLFIGKNYISFETLDSTNDYLKALTNEKKLPEGTVVTAANQTKGRGQAGNSWLVAPDKNCTFSILLHPTFLPIDKQFYLNMAVSLGIKDACEYLLGDTLHIKWPNDIFYIEKKIAGILIENTIQGSKIVNAVVGIGLNVNQLDFAGINATSLSIAANSDFELKEVETVVFSHIEKYYAQLRLGHFNFLEKAYITSLFRYQQTHEFMTEKKKIRGQIIGVSKDGKLLIESEDKVLKFGLKEIVFLYD